MAEQDVFSIEFDSTKFIQSIEQTIAVMKKLEAEGGNLDEAMKVLAAQVNKVSFTKPITEVNKLKSVIEQSKFKLDFDGVNRTLDEFSKDIPAMKRLLDELKAKLATTTDGKEFDELRKAISQVEQGLSELEGDTQETAQAFVPLRKKIKEGTIALQELEDAGLENTERYRQLQREVARLTDDFNDQRATIRALASDTFAIEAGIEGIQGVTAAFQVYEGALAATGVSAEELQAVQTKLTAILNVANGVQTIQNLLQKESKIAIAANSLATTVSAAAQRVLAIGTTQAATAQATLNAAMAATPWGAVLAVIGGVVAAIYAFSSANDNAAESQEKVNERLQNYLDLENQRKNVLDRDTRVALAKAQAEGKSEKDLAKIREDGLRAQKDNITKTEIEQQKELDKYINLSKQIVKKSELRYDQMGNAYIVYVDKQRGLNEEELKNQKAIEKAITETRQRQSDIQAEIDVQRFDKQSEANKKSAENSKKTYDEIENLTDQYYKKLQQIQNDAENIKDEQSPKSEKSIRAKYARQLKLEIAENKKLFAKLGPAKVAEINKQATTLSELQADAEVKGFNKEQAAARDELVRNLKDQQQSVITERISLIENEYDRVNAEIKNQEEKRKEEINRQLEDTKKSINDQFAQGLISKEDADKFIGEAEEVAKESAKLVSKVATKDLLENNKKLFDTLLSQAEQYAALANAQAEGSIAKAILKESENLKKGEITFQQYQDRVTNIQKKAGEDRLDLVIKNGEAELAILNDKLNAESDAVKKAAIQTQIEVTQKAIDEAKTQKNLINKEFEGVDNILFKLFGLEDDAKAKEKIDKFKDKVSQAIRATTDLLKQSAAAEVEAADRAVASQQKRVDEAVKIAEEGNAEYLKQEEDRLRELELKREQAARKQLQIDAAVQASQILVAIASATADAFTKKEGPIGVATNIASIIAAIAAGAGLVRSLQNTRPSFYEGTDYVSRGTNKVGRDTIPAMLHEGEAVISARENRRYGPTIKAIRRGLIPEDAVNSFVRNYTKGVNYDTIGKAVEYSRSKEMDTSKFVEMNDRLARLESVMSLTAQAIQNLGVNVKMDSDGFAASINTYMNKKNKILRS